MLFISYSRADHEPVGHLQRDLHALGQAVWLDEELSGGQIWWEEILTKIRQSEAFLFLVSPSSVESEACLSELNYAVSVQRAVIPIEVTPTNPATVPLVLSQHQIIPYSRGDKSEVIALSRALAQVDLGRALPDPLPPLPLVPGSYLAALRDQIHSAEALSMDQQLGLLHRLELRAEEESSEEVLALLAAFRARADVLASIATQIDALRQSLEASARGGRTKRARGDYRFRMPGAFIDRAAIVLVLAALLSAGAAMTGALWEVDGNGWRHWGDPSPGLERWQLGALLILFGLGVVLSFNRVRAVQKAASAAVLCVALYGLVGWWWRSGIVRLLLQENTGGDTGPVRLGLGITASGLSLLLQVVSGVILTVMAFSPATGRPQLQGHGMVRR